MYICYVDESGHCGRKFNPKQPVEVVCGVLTDVSKLFKTQREHTALLRDLGLGELKSADAYRGRKEWGAVAPTERDALFEKLMNWADERKCKIIPCPIDAERFFSDKEADGEISKRLVNPYEAGAINVVLALQRLQKSKKNNKGKTLVVFDEQQDHDENLLRILSGDLAFTDPYTGYRLRPRARNQEPRLDQIIDVPHFSKSHLAVLIQIADFAAFIMCRYLAIAIYGRDESYAGEREKIVEWHRRIGTYRVPHTATDPPGSADICKYFRNDVRPTGWAAKDWAL